MVRIHQHVKFPSIQSNCNKKESTLSSMPPQRLSIKVQLEKKMPKIQNCYLGQTLNLYLVNHPEVSTWEIWSCYNKKSDERNQQSHYMDTRQSERWNFKEITKISNFRICHKTQHATHLLKLVDKICKYEMDSAHRRTDGQTDKVKPVYPASTSLGVGWGGGGGIIKEPVWNG